MAPKFFQRVVYVLLGSGLIFLLAACQPSIPPTTGNGTPASTTTGSTPGITSTASGDTAPVPTTTTNCPPAGTARAAVLATLALGHHPNIVYIVNQGTSDAPGLGTLKRFDATTGQKTEIINLSPTYISEAQLSADGQWLLFVAISGGQAKLQMVRMDGQGLQTLYCVSPEGGANILSAISHVQWSTNQRMIVFSHFSANGGSRNQIYLLNTSSGSIQLELAIPGVTYQPVTWLDTARVYLSRQLPDGPADSLYLLDTGRGAHQPESNLTLVYQDNITGNFQACWSADSSFDGSTAFISTCSEPGSATHPGASAQEGPGFILTQPATGGTSHRIYSNNAAAITAVRAITRTTLLFTADAQAYDSSVHVDQSQNGLWKVNITGTGATRLTTMTGTLNSFTQYPWSNVSRDGSLYTLQSYIPSTNTYLMSYGSLSGGTPTTFASISGTQLATIGWTTM